MKEKILSFYKGNVSASECYDTLEKALREIGIYTDLTMIGAMATVRIEVGKNFKPIREYASGEAYEGRKDLGNIVHGDGLKFKGRGFIQLTGRNNYTNYGKIFGIDLVNNPDLALGVDVSAKVLAQYFKDRQCDIACNVKNWTLVRKKVNGGTNGLEDFLRVVGEYLKVVNL